MTMSEAIAEYRRVVNHIESEVAQLDASFRVPSLIELGEKEALVVEFIQEHGSIHRSRWYLPSGDIQIKVRCDDSLIRIQSVSATRG